MTSIRYFRERAGELSEERIQERAGIRQLEAWRAYAFFKMMKGFLYRGVYMGLARKCVRYF